jgi:hypothetical protein
MRLATCSRSLAALALICLIATPAFAISDHLLLSEAVVTPTAGEYIELYNPTAAPLVLGDIYLSDDEDYALYPGTFGGGPAPAISSSDFIVQFPAGAMLGSCDVLVVAFDGAGFINTYGFAADYEIKGTDPGTPDMIASNVGATAGLTNSGENVTVFLWDGSSDLVQDVDMSNIGTPSATNDIANKTGVLVDGPDADLLASAYNVDAFTMPMMGGDPGFGFSQKRTTGEGGEILGGNGFSGDDETTEDVASTFDWNAVPSPGQLENFLADNFGCAPVRTENDTWGTLKSRY